MKPINALDGTAMDPNDTLGGAEDGTLDGMEDGAMDGRGVGLLVVSWFAGRDSFCLAFFHAVESLRNGL